MVPQESIWVLDTDMVDGQAQKRLLITLAKPPLSEPEKKWKKGKPQDNRAKQVCDM